MNILSNIWNHIQKQLFPWLEQELDSLSEKEREFVQIVSLIDLPNHVKIFNWRGFGRKKESRLTIAKAFIAKAVFNFETTELLIEYLKSCKNIRILCGWDFAYEVPSPSTFSRAFEEFATHGLPQKIHEAMVTTHCGQKLAGHISRDATAIEVREKPLKKNQKLFLSLRASEGALVRTKFLLQNQQNALSFRLHEAWKKI
jgi:hypothetical protein